MTMLKQWVALAVAGLTLAGCSTIPNAEDDFQAAQAALDQHIQTLASDEYEGRAPGTEGGRKTEQYIADTLASYGYKPGASEESFMQPVELVRLAPGEGSLTSAGQTFVTGDGVLFRPTGMLDVAVVNSRVTVFAPDAEEPGKNTLIRRSAVIFSEMIYNGKATPLFDAQAESIIIIADSQEHFDQLKRSFSSNRLRVAEPEPATLYVLLSPAEGERFAGTLGKTAAGLKEMAAGRDNGAWQFRNPIDFKADSQATKTVSHNVIGKLPGKVPGSGALLVLAHWDHLGNACGPADAEDRLCNGAVDNASGIGVMLETARRIAAAGGLDRDLYVMGTTAEESGLLGAEAFAENPPMPLPTIVAAFNIDTVAIAPRGASTTVVGWGRTPLDAGIRKVVEGMGRAFKVDPYTDQFVRRQDGWALLSRDVPAVLVSTSFGDEEAFSEFLSGPYHGADDEWSEDIELGGATDDIFTHIALLKHFGSVAEYQPGEDESEDLMDKAIMGDAPDTGGEE